MSIRKEPTGAWLRIYYKECVSTTRQADPDDQWDRDDTATDRYYEEEAEIVYSDEHPDWKTQPPPLIQGADSSYIPIPPDRSHVNTWYVVYVGYSTGDSFGHDENEYVEFVDVFEDRDLANGLNVLIEDNYRRDPSFSTEYRVKYLGNEYYTGAWKGYFESIHEQGVLELRVVRRQ